MRRLYRAFPYAVVVAAIVGSMGAGVVAAPYHRAESERPPTVAHPAKHGRCFPRSEWNGGSVPQRFAPCARIARVEEDGSVILRVSDRDGIVRYSLGVGVPNRAERAR